MRRSILFIFIPAAVMLIVLIGAIFNYILAQNVSSPDTKRVYMINLTSGGNGTRANASAQNTQPSSALNENEKIKSTENMFTKCLSSALCPDYDYHPSSIWEA
jgi:hypothetical protein